MTAGLVLEVVPQFNLEFLAGREGAILMSENGYALEGEAGLPFVRD